MKRKFIALTVVVLCALAAWDGTAWAQNCTGRTKRVPQDCRTIQMAVDRASAGDIILIRPGTYRENVEIRNKRRLTFEAERATDNRAVIVQGRTAGTDPIFQIDNSDDITFENAFVFQNGTAGLLINNSERVQLTHSQNAHLIIQDNEQSGIVMSGGSLSGEFVIVQNNGTDGAGWGIELSGSAQFQLANTQILKNPSGGVIVTTGASVQLDQSEIIDSLGPGVYAKEGAVQLTDTLVSKHTQVGLLLEMSSATLRGGVIEGNGAEGINASSSQLVADGTTIRMHPTHGVLLTDSSASFSSSSAIENNLGFGVLAQRSTLILADSKVTTNGDGVQLQMSSATVQRSLIDANGMADATGIGIRALEGSSLTMSGSQVTRHPADGVFLDASSASVHDSGISANGGRGLGAQGSSAELQRSEVKDNGQDGVELENSSLNAGELTIADNGNRGLHAVDSGAVINTGTISGHPNQGVLLERSSLGMNAVSVVQNGREGLKASDSSATAGPGTRLEGNGADGVSLEASSLNANGTLIQGNQGSGVLAESATLTLVESAVSGHPQDGIKLTSSSANLRDTAVQNNQGHGLSAVDSASIALSGGSVVDNGQDGLSLMRSAAALSGVAVSSNRAGLVLQDRSSASLSECTVEGNDDDGIRVQTGTVDVSGGSVSDNGGHGIVATARSALAVVGAAVSGNEGDGIHLEQAALALRDSQVQNNGGFGVFADAASVASGTGNAISGNNPDVSDQVKTL